MITHMEGVALFSGVVIHIHHESHENNSKVHTTTDTVSYFTQQDNQIVNSGYNAPSCDNTHHNNNNEHMALVSFYISIFPHDVGYVALWKGLEVVDMLSDVYVARYRNVKGQHYGFARFTKVQDIEKLNKALSNVLFDNWRLYTNFACFDRFGGKEVAGRLESEGGKILREKVGKNKRELGECEVRVRRRGKESFEN